MQTLHCDPWENNTAQGSGDNRGRSMQLLDGVGSRLPRLSPVLLKIQADQTSFKAFSHVGAGGKSEVNENY